MNELIPTAELFGRLLLRELDADQLVELQGADVAAALAALGIEVPAADDLEALRAEFFALFLHPEHGAPPIGSLWTDGQYEGDSTIALRRIAEAAGCEFDRDAAAGAAVDHAGSVLMLWASCVESDPELARLLANEHLEFVARALAAAAQRDGFYGQLSRAVIDLVASIRT